MRAGVAVAALLCGCTDGATRLAYEIQAGAAALQRSDASTYEIRHVPEASPSGCGDAYTVQLSANAGLIIWCKDSRGSAATSSHITTYHLRFVEVPQTFKLDKAAGETTLIEIAKRNGAVVVTAVR